MADYATGLQMVLDRRAAALFGDRPVLIETAMRSPSARNSCIVLRRTLTREPLALAMRRGDDDFRLLVDRSLSRLFRSKDLARALHALFRPPDRMPVLPLDFLPECGGPARLIKPRRVCMQTLGVHCEVGKLRTVMVCRPGLAHQRLTPGNCHDLLFDDVIWVHEAQKDHYDFVLKMRERGIEVLDLHEMLAETLEDKAARDFVLDRRITANDVGLAVAASACGPGSTRCRRRSLPST